MKENIIINYLLLEQILRIIGAYETICDEYEFLPEIFKQARTGDINSLLQNDGVKDTTFGIIEELTGVSVKYWSGQKRIKLGIRCKNSNLIDYHTKSIDEINLSNDDGTMYKEIMNNPLSLYYEEVYLSTVGLNRAEVDEEVMEQELVIIDSLYSLRGLITVLLINIKDANGIRLFDKRELLYKHTKWKPYMRELTKPTKHDITYCPKYVEIRKGLVQTIIQNILLTGYVPLTIKEL